MSTCIINKHHVDNEHVHYNQASRLQRARALQSSITCTTCTCVIIKHHVYNKHVHYNQHHKCSTKLVWDNDTPIIWFICIYLCLFRVSTCVYFVCLPVFISCDYLCLFLASTYVYFLCLPMFISCVYLCLFLGNTCVYCMPIHFK